MTTRTIFSTGRIAGLARFAVLAASLTACGQEDPASAPVPAGIQVGAAALEIRMGGVDTIEASVVDAEGRPIGGSRPAFAIVGSGAPFTLDSARGIITGTGPGTGRVRVSFGAFADTVDIGVLGRPDLALGINRVPVSTAYAPYGVAVTRSGTAHVTLLGGSGVVLGDVATGTVGEGYAVGPAPTGVALDAAGARAFVTVQGAARLAVVDAASRQVLGAATLAGNPFVVRPTHAGTAAWVTTNNGRMYLVNASTRAVTDSLGVGQAPNGIAIARGDTVLWVANTFSNTVTKYDTRTRATVDTIAVTAPQEIVLSADGTELYVARSGGVDFVSAATGAVLGSAAFPGQAFGMALSPDGTQLWVTVPSRGVIEVVYTTGRSPVRTVPVGGNPRRIAFDYYGGNVVVADQAGAVLFIK